MDMFFKKENCDRCHSKLTSRIQSLFTDDVICMACSQQEKEIKRRAVESGLGDMEGCGFVPRYPINNHKKERE